MMSLEETFNAACEFSLITHPDPRCVVACCICTVLIRGIIRGEVTCEAHVNAIVKRSFTWVHSWIEYGAGKVYLKTDTHNRPLSLLGKHEFDKHTQAESLDELNLDDVSKMGYVYKALGAAILLLRLAIRRTETGSSTTDARLRLFEPLIQELIMEGGDADTNACVAGALLGAWVGYSALPSDWRDGIGNKTWLLGKTEGLCQVLGVSDRDSGYQGSKDPDTRT
jgi:ADP-ribosylglycohydrolase